VQRTTGDTFHQEFAFATIDRLGGSVQKGFLRRYDVLAESYLERYKYMAPDFRTNIPTSSYETSFRHLVDFGVRVGPTRFGVNATYLQRYADFLTGRNYGTFLIAANFTYGVLQVRADQ
jgi:hypothetical protein